MPRGPVPAFSRDQIAATIRRRRVEIDDGLTPVSAFYIRNNFPIPAPATSPRGSPI